MFLIYGVSIQKKKLGKMQFWTILLHFALCVTKRRKYVDKGCNLVNPYPITVLLKIPFNKLPSFGTQFSSTGVQEPFCKHWLSIVVERFPVIAQHFKIVFTKPLHFIRFSLEGLFIECDQGRKWMNHYLHTFLKQTLIQKIIVPE